MTSFKLLKYESVSNNVGQPIVNPSPHAWKTSDFGSLRSRLPPANSGRQPDLLRAHATIDLESPKRRARASNRNTSATKLPSLTFDAKFSTQKATPSCYPDLTHLSRSQQLMRRWESLPSFGNTNLTDADLDAIHAAFGGSRAGNDLASLPVALSSENDSRKTSKSRKAIESEKAWPFIPCSCCHGKGESALDRLHIISLSARGNSRDSLPCAACNAPA